MLNYKPLVCSVPSFYTLLSYIMVLCSYLGHGGCADLLHFKLLLTIRRYYWSNAAVNLDSLVLVSPGKHLRLSDNKLILLVDAVEVILVRVLASTNDVVALAPRAAMMHLELLMTSS